MIWDTQTDCEEPEKDLMMAFKLQAKWNANEYKEVGAEQAQLQSTMRSKLTIATQERAQGIARSYSTLCSLMVRKQKGFL